MILIPNIHNISQKAHDLLYNSMGLASTVNNISNHGDPTAQHCPVCVLISPLTHGWNWVFLSEVLKSSKKLYANEAQGKLVWLYLMKEQGHTNYMQQAERGGNRMV